MTSSPAAFILTVLCPSRIPRELPETAHPPWPGAPCITQYY